MKFLKNHRKMGVVGIALTIALIGGGIAVGFWTTSGTGAGSATIGTASSIKIEPLTTSSAAYDSLFSPLPASVVSQSYEATGTAEYGNQIALSGGSGQTLSTVVQTMDSWACGSGDWTGDSGPCVTSANATFNEPITLSVYNVGPDNAVGTLITSDTQTFAIPYRPSASASCPGQQWLASDGSCHDGYAFNITFNNFDAAVLPANVIYGISYSTGPGPNGGNGGTDPAASLNVGLTTEPTEPTVGTDPLSGTGSDYISITDANGGGYALNNYCDDGGVSTPFRYDPGPCTGTGAINYPPSTTNYIPATEFNMTDAGTLDLYPGATQNVDFSISNFSGTPALVQGVTFSILASDLPAGCSASWFTLTQPTTANDVTIAPNSTVDFTGSGGSITLINEPTTNQDACEGITVPLIFTSS